MSVFKKLEDSVKRMEVQKTWKARLGGLEMSHAAFCDKYELNNSILSRLINLKIAAGELSYNKIESALKKENL